MAAQERIAQAGEAARALRNSPAVQRLMQDAELRANIQEAYALSRKAYGRLNNGRPPTKALLEDKKLQRELRDTAELLRDAGLALKEGPVKPRRRLRLGRVLLVGLVGAVAALALSEGLRKKVLDALFGAEEEFDYTSTTTPVVPTPAPAPAADAAEPAEPAEPAEEAPASPA